MLTKTIEAGRTSGAVDDASLDEIAVDTTVMEKNIAHPTDSRLYERARAQLVDLARQAGIERRQSHARLRTEFGTKVSIATTLKRGFVVGARSLSANPCDGHTLGEALERVAILTGHPPKRAAADRGRDRHGQADAGAGDP